MDYERESTTFLVFYDHVFTSDHATLRSPDYLNSPKVRAALRWYIKGLAAGTDMARFMFAWIAGSSAISAVRNPGSAAVKRMPRCRLTGVGGRSPRL